MTIIILFIISAIFIAESNLAALKNGDGCVILKNGVCMSMSGGKDCCSLGHKKCCSGSIGIPAHPKPECIGKGRTPTKGQNAAKEKLIVKGNASKFVLRNVEISK
uniref:Uncharacterized protein n=1 Tax=Meloidogyne enterolobii TaxID=390850 RepID=A0A6V7WL01_MELEN|nr:unnamed protein product [Meloidogyne enterolobii]